MLTLQSNIHVMPDKRYNILMAEDEGNIADFVSRGLSDFGYTVEAFADGKAAWEAIDSRPNAFDLLLLDIRMPGMTGLEVCEKLREKYGYKTPVIMLTALGTTDDIVLGLHAGADDYIVKPFKFVELVARIKAILRRGGATANTTEYQGMTLDPTSHKVVRDGVTVELSTKEYRLLEYMVSHHGEVLSRRQLLKDVWDKDFDTNTNVVDVYVRYLRGKIDNTFGTKLIHTIVGIGYMLS